VRLTTENTAVVLDSTADFPEAPDRFPNFRVVPLYVRFGDESFRDYVDIDPQRFYARLESAPELPTTSQPTPADFLAVYEDLVPRYADFLAVYEDLVPRYERVLSLQISSTLSGTFASAQTAAQELGSDTVRVIDTRTVSASLALLAIGVQRRLERGTTDEEVDAFVARHARDHRLLFTVNTLEYLARGGRIGKAAAFAGNLLNVKPILTIRDGEVVPLKRVRGNQKAFAEFERAFVESSTDSPTLRVGIAHAAAPERMEALRKMVRATRPQAQVEVATTLGAVVGTHAGPGTVGFFWFDDPI
jgi:DegV family protein with EDD domain